MAKPQCEHDCRSDRLGLQQEQLGALTGFTRRAFAALAHLREAWLVADAGNVRGVEAAIRGLLESRSMREARGLVAQALRNEVASDQAPGLLMAVGLTAPGLVPADVPREGPGVSAVCGLCHWRELTGTDGPEGTTVCQPCQQSHGVDHRGRPPVKSYRPKGGP